MTVMNIDDGVFIRRLRNRLRQKPGSRLFLSLAEELMKRDLLEEAFALLSDGCRRQPDFIAAKLTLGRWYLGSRRFSEASALFSEALKQDPANYFARKGLAEANKALGISAEMPEVPVPGPAGAIFSELAEIDRLISHGHYGSAMKLYQELLAENPDDKLILQRKEELAVLMSFSTVKQDAVNNDGKDGVIKQLNGFLEAIKIHFASKAAL